MVEHVGVSQGDEYASQIARVLKPGGRVLNHGIAWIPHEPTGGHLGADFSLRYVFPDAEVQNLSRMQLSLEKAGLETLHIENLHSDYAETLRHWAMRLDDNLEEARQVAGEERLRVWRLYLRAARNGFETGLTGVYQMLCSHPIVEEPSGPPKGLRHSEARAAGARGQLAVRLIAWSCSARGMRRPSASSPRPTRRREPWSG